MTTTNNRYRVIITDDPTKVMTCLAPSAAVAATRARDNRATWLRFNAPGRPVGACEATAISDTDPADRATDRYGR